MTPIEKAIVPQINAIDWNRFFAFHRGINKDLALNHPENRMAKAAVLQHALTNVSGLMREPDGFAHNFTLMTPDGTARILVRFDNKVTYRTKTNENISNEKVNVIVKNRQDTDSTPTLNDVDAILVIGGDVAFLYLSSELIKAGNSISPSNHQYLIRNLKRWDDEHVNYHQTDDAVASFTNPLSRQIDQMLYSFAQNV